MKRTQWLGLTALLSASLTVSAADSPNVIHLATLEWMPYTGKLVPSDGLSTAVIAEAAKQMGRTVKVDYFVWKDAVAAGESDPSFTGYYPVYYTEERAKSKCYLSASIGKSTTGIAYLKDAPIQWKSVANLASWKIGVVEGYSNGEQFDAAVQSGAQPVELSPSDTVNLKKLISKKVPAIVVEKFTLRYMTRNTAARDKIVFDEKPLFQQDLYVCFKRTPAGKATQEAFDAALKKVDIPKFENAYFKTLDASDK
jgi:polar amino acid transport system substrate-binding protein